MRWKRIKEAFLLLPMTAAFALLLFRGEIAAAAAQRGLDSCLHSVIPELFPFLVLTNLLLRSKLPRMLPDFLGRGFEKLFQIRRTALPAFVAGLVGGYPTGAAAAAECCRLNLCSAEEAERLIVFANNCSPGFLFGLVSMRLPGGVRDGLCLLLLEWGISVCLGVLLGIGRSVSLSDAKEPTAAEKSISGRFASSVASGGRSVLLISAYVVFFSVFAAFLPESALLRGTIELTGGILLLKESLVNEVTAAFLVGFGGLSVACQVISALEGSGISARLYLPFRFLHGLLMALGTACMHFGAPYLLLFCCGTTAVVFFLKTCRKRAISEI